MNKLRMAVIGNGFVGKAVVNGFNTPLVETYIVDPILGTSLQTMIRDFGFNVDVMFVSVPTPMGSTGEIDSSIIESVLHDISMISNSIPTGMPKFEPIVVIKSTITPDVLQKIEKIYSRIVYNPEFLTERNASADFINADMLILGGRNQKDLEFVEHIYAQYSLCVPCPVFKVDLEAASMIKYTLNCFMATKVLFFNELKNIYDKTNTKVEWDTFTNILSADQRMGKTHMKVPGPDGKLGFGGACFVKDTAALINYAEKVSSAFTLLKHAVNVNNNIRLQYELDDREKEQNVSFKL